MIFFHRISSEKSSNVQLSQVLRAKKCPREFLYYSGVCNKSNAPLRLLTQPLSKNLKSLLNIFGRL
jgi:hypothetical protein